MKPHLLPLFVGLFLLSATLPAQVTLSIDPVYEGGTATFRIDNGAANGVVVLCYSRSGTGPTTLPSGLSLDLSNPIGQLEPFQLSAQGHGELGPLPVPNSMSVGTQGWVQGVQIDLWSLPTLELTNMVPVVVEPPPGTVAIPGGTFEMGDHHGVGDFDEQPVHTVTLDAFLMDTYEVTNELYAAYLNDAYAAGTVTVSGNDVKGAGNNQVYFHISTGISFSGSTFSVTKPNHPVVNVSWYGACAYANWRSEQQGLTPCYNLSTWGCDFNADGWRLPTEAEWEYAARGGSSTYTQYHWGNTIDGSHANYLNSGDPFDNGTTPVGYYDGNQTPSGVDMMNGYGLYDMSGNVFEWCNDWYDSTYYSNSPSSNPTGPSSGSHRVIRGGSLFHDASTLRSARRTFDWPALRYFTIGFRLASARP